MRAQPNVVSVTLREVVLNGMKKQVEKASNKHSFMSFALIPAVAFPNDYDRGFLSGNKPFLLKLLLAMMFCHSNRNLSKTVSSLPTHIQPSGIPQKQLQYLVPLPCHPFGSSLSLA